MGDEVAPESAVVAGAMARLAKLAEIALRDVELSLPQYRLLTYLTPGSAPAAALAERLIVSRPSVTTLVDGLVARGLVERRADPDDRRRVDHVLTIRGRRLLRRADEAIAGSLVTLTDHLEPDDAAAARRGLVVLHRALDLALAEREADHDPAASTGDPVPGG